MTEEQQFFDIADLYPLSYLDPETRVPCARVRQVRRLAQLDGVVALEADASTAPA